MNDQSIHQEGRGEPQARLAALVDACPHAMVTLSTQLTIESWNAGAESLYGRTRREAVGQPATMLWTSETADLHRHLFASARAGRCEMETRHWRSDGTHVDVRVTVAPVVDGEQMAGFAACIEDISELKRTRTGLADAKRLLRSGQDAGRRDGTSKEDKASEREQQYRSLFELSPNGLVIIDPTSGRIVDCNAQAARNLGYTGDELKSLTLTDIEDVAVTERVLARLLRTASANHLADRGAGKFETRHRTKEGAWRDVCVSSRAITFEGRECHFSVWEDITDRKASERDRDKLVQLIEASSDFIAVSEFDGHLSFMNAGARQMIGLAPDADVSALRPVDFVAEEWKSFFRDVAWRSAQDKGYWKGEMQLRHLETGALIDVVRHAFVLRDPDTLEPWCLGTVTRDVSDRKQIEDALRASERRMAAILEALPIGVILADRNGRVLLGNAFAETFTPGAVPSHADRQHSLWEGYDENGNRIERMNYPAARALRGERVWPGQEFIFHGDEAHGPRWIRVAAIPFRDDDGAVIGAIAVIADIDQEKRARDALADSERRLALALSSGRMGLWEWDIEQGSSVWNAVEYELLGLPEGNGREPTRTFFDRVHPDDMPEFSRRLDEVMKEGTEWLDECRIIRPDGEVRWLVGVGRLFRGRDGAARTMIGVNYDITDRKLAESQSELLLRELNHRAKNMLSVVQSVARHTAATTMADFRRRFEERLQSLAANQELLIKSQWHGVDVETLVRAQLSPFVDLLGGRIDLRGPRLAISAATSQALGMVFHELATNAAKHGSLSNEAGRVEIGWTVETSPADQPQFRMWWVESGGPGVKPPTRRGFGSAVLERITGMTLNADVALEFNPDGVRWRLSCPLARVCENDAGEPGSP